MSDGRDQGSSPEETDEHDDQSMGNTPSSSYEKDAVQDAYENYEAAAAAAQIAHTEFLDLTNGEGGEILMQDAGSYDEDEDEEDDGEIETPMRSAAKNKKYNPGTPGKVVEAGNEHTGRWTREEHEAFLSALQVYGKEWKKVAAKVKTRTVVQTRTHAQKYFQKLQKAMETSGGKGVSDVYVEMGVAAEAKKVSSTQKRKRNAAVVTATAPTGAITTLSSAPLATMSTKAPRTASLTSAAQLISNLAMPQPSSISVVAPLADVLSTSQPQQQQQVPAPHGFTTTADTSFHRPFSSSGGWNTATTAGGIMKIVAPGHDSAMKRGKFPEPSPAASGKRKLAEIAAARMLAGVGNGGGGNSSNPTPSTFSTTDGDATPPPIPEFDYTLQDMPELAGVAAVAAVPEARKGFALQIVNPEILGNTQDYKRRTGGQGSPQTPWDGQLEALVSNESKIKEILTSEVGVGGPPVVNNNNNGSSPAAEVAPQLLPVCGPATSYGRSALHKAVCEVDFRAVLDELSIVANQSLVDRRDQAGFCPLHTACALPLCHPNVWTWKVCDIVRLLLKTGADVAASDANDNTALHWASRTGKRDVVQLLLPKGCPLDAKNKQGETPLHWALRVGRKGMEVASLLLESGARPTVQNLEFKRPIDVSADGFLDEERSPCHYIDDLVRRNKKLSKEQKKHMHEVLQERREAREQLFILSTQSRTLVLHHPECLEHMTKSKTDWEAPDRVTSIMRRILPATDAAGVTETSGIFPHEVTVSQEFDRAKIELLRRIHSTDYLAFVNKLSKDLERQHRDAMDADAARFSEDAGFSSQIGSPPVVPFTPMVQRSMIKIDEPKVKLGVHSDTSFCSGSLKAARRAAGAVQHAVDCVLVGRNRNAFCVVRPPGHHAGTNGLLDGGESCGFCIFNNVAAGALHAISDERLLCERCAIVDFDVHHGNGTEEIVRKCQDPRKLFFFSIHLFDNERRKRGTNNYKFYPGTGDEDDVAFNIINVPIAPLWKENGSQSGPGTPVNTHNTRQKARRRPSQEGDDVLSEEGSPRDRISDVESEVASSRGGSSTVAAASPRKPGLSMAGRQAYRDAIQNRLLPALRAFNPDLILISAGFDAAKGDVGNARHDRGGRERMGLDLEPDDYAWTTRKVLQVADICCQGRVVSVLEGGYGRTPLQAVAAQLQQQPASSVPPEETSLDRTFFAECAVRHLHAMIDPYDSECRFPA